MTDPNPDLIERVAKALWVERHRQETGRGNDPYCSPYPYERLIEPTKEDLRGYARAVAEATGLGRMADWLARNIIANEIHLDDEPLPVGLRGEVAAAMVRDQDFLGWPDIKAAQATLEEWKWE